MRCGGTTSISCTRFCRWPSKPGSNWRCTRDDPPVESLGGVARIMRSFDGFKRALEVAESPNHGLDFCMGCWSEMGRDVLGPLRYFASRGKVFYVHFRDVQGRVPEFRECFLGEGNVDIVHAMRTLHECGFTGFLIDDHVPHMLNDTDWGHRGRALATGQMLGLLAAVRAAGLIRPAGRNTRGAAAICRECVEIARAGS